MIERVVCWYSCGVTSAIATRLTLQKYKDKYPIEIAYCDTGSEHPDNKRFLSDCEEWFGQRINILKNPNYKDTWDVYKKDNYLAGVQGQARCSYMLKKKVRQDFENIKTDLQIFGYDFNEQKRVDRFRKNNPEVNVEFPLFENGITKVGCLNILTKIGIEIPMMYKLGYKNNNCIGCVKGAKGYWNKIRKDFPNVFERMAKEERRLGIKINVMGVKGKVVRVYLDELPPNKGNYKSELPISCGLLCGE